MSVFGFLWRYARKMKMILLVVLLLAVVETSSGRFVNFYASRMVDDIASGTPSQALYAKLCACLGLIFLCMVLQTFANIGNRFVSVRFLPYFSGVVSKDLFLRAHKHSSSFFAEEMAGNISSKIKTILNNIEQMYYHLLGGLLMPVLTFLSCFALIAKIRLSMALWFMLFCAIFQYFVIKLQKHVVPLSVLRARLFSESNGILVDSLANADLVKNSGCLGNEKRLYFGSVLKALRTLGKEKITSSKIELAAQLLTNFMCITFYVLAFVYWRYQNLTVGEVVLAVSLISTMLHATQNMSWFFCSIIQLCGGIRDGLDLLYRPIEICDSPNAVPLKIKTAHIAYRQVDFAYQTGGALFKNFSLDIPAGVKVGLVGHSGSGKSSLVKLLSRFYDVQGGKITINGKDIRSLTQESLRRNIALIPQEANLFNRTILENIRYGNPHAADEDVIAAAKNAYAHEFISKLPQGYNSKVGERGIMLSGGERQRIAIARAILKNAPVLILDEATAALDSESEYYIQQALRRLMKRKTVIAIAHRLSTLKEMDKIVVLDDGKIIETGTHDELLHKKGAYYKFYNMQSSGFNIR